MICVSHRAIGSNSCAVTERDSTASGSTSGGGSASAGPRGDQRTRRSLTTTDKGGDHRVNDGPIMAPTHPGAILREEFLEPACKTTMSARWPKTNSATHWMPSTPQLPDGCARAHVSGALEKFRVHGRTQTCSGHAISMPHTARQGSQPRISFGPRGTRTTMTLVLENADLVRCRDSDALVLEP